MPLFRYRAKEGAEKIVEGKIEAIAKEMAIKKIEEMGYFPVKIEEIAQDSPAQALKKSAGRISYREVTIFTRHLATLIKSGVPILRGLGVIAEQTSNLNLKRVASDIHNELREGSRLSSSLARYPKVFSSFYLAMVTAGEDSGNLDTVLFRIAGYRHSQEDIISKVKLALIYPLIMLIVGLGTVIFMLTFVVPRLTKIFQDTGEQLPLITKILIQASQYLTSWKGAGLLGVILVFIFLVRFELKRQTGKKLASIIQLRLPVLGDLTLKKELARISRTLELLIKSGVGILKAIELTAPIVDNEVIKESLIEGYKELKQGELLGKTLHKSKVFPPFMTSLIAIGEESGKLDVSFTELANAYEKDTEDVTQALTTILEPVMIVVMGLIVGFVVIGMLLPIFQINLMMK